MIVTSLKGEVGIGCNGDDGGSGDMNWGSHQVPCILVKMHTSHVIPTTPLNVGGVCYFTDKETETFRSRRLKMSRWVDWLLKPLSTLILDPGFMTTLKGAKLAIK